MTNTASSVAGAITGSVSSAYDTAITIAVATIAIGMVIYFVRKGLKARA
jgi:hypothetical protein